LPSVSKSEEVNYIGVKGGHNYPIFTTKGGDKIMLIMLEGKNMEHQIMDFTNNKTHLSIRGQLSWKIIKNNSIGIKKYFIVQMAPGSR